MKRIVAFTLMVFATLVSAQTVTTPNIGLQLPAAGSTNWNLPLNYNFNLLDQLFGGPLIPGAKVAYQPIFSNGSPVAVCGPNNQGLLDFDYSANPFTSYVCRGTSWSLYGGGGGGGGASFPSTPGVVYNTSSIASRNALYSDIVALWSTCTSGQLAYNGICTNNITGNAATATQLATAGSDCPSGQYQFGSDARGNALCTALPTQPGSQYIGPQIVSGCGVQYVTGLTYTVGACTYSINNITYNSPLTNVTLPAADGTNPTIDVIYVDNTQTVNFIQGTPAVTPQEPTLNSSTQLGLTFVLVPATSTTPANTLVTDIYLDGSEWNYSPGANVNPLSTNNPYQGIYDVEFGSGGPATTASSIIFTDPSSGSINLSNYNNLLFYIRNKAAWPSQCSLAIQWYDPGFTTVGGTIVLGSGTFGLNTTTNLTTYQQVSIPTQLFGTGINAVGKLGYFVRGTGCTWNGFYLDFVSVQGGVGTNNPSSTIMNFRGPWSTSASYAPNDVVTNGLLSYVALAANTNVALTSSATWAQLSAGNTVSTGGTNNQLAKFNGVNSIINSLFADDGVNGSYIGTGGFTATSVRTNGASNGFLDLTTQGTPNAVPVTNTVRIASPDVVTTPYQIKLPSVPPPDSTHTYLKCSFANPSICTWDTGGGGGSSSISMAWTVNSGTPLIPAAALLQAPATGTISNCYFTTTTSDSVTALTFNIKLAGTNIISGTNATVSAGTSSGTVSTFSLTSGTISVTQGNSWELDITAGTSNWIGAVQCY